jgi:hypothetical protein
MVVGMDIGAVVERVEHISAVRSHPTADADLVQSGLVAIREVQAWCDAQHAGLVARLRDIDCVPRAAHRQGLEEVVGAGREVDGAVHDVGEDPEPG